MPSPKRVLVLFGSSTVRKKAFNLPGESTCKDFEYLKQHLVAELSASSETNICSKDIILSRFDAVFEEDVELCDQDVLENGDKLAATVLMKKLVTTTNHQPSPQENLRQNQEAPHQSSNLYRMK